MRSPLKITEGETETTETEIKSVVLNGAVFANWSSNYAKVREFYCDIISSLGENCFKGNTSLTKVEVGGSAETMPKAFLYGCTSLQTAKFDFPNLRKIDGTFISACKSSIDISMIVTPGVTNVAGYACQYSFLRGDIALTNVVALGGGAFKNAALTNVFLAGSLTALEQYVFQTTDKSTITNVVLDLPNLTTVAANAFNNQKKIRRVELVTALTDMGLVTNIVKFADNGSINELSIYVSKKQWTPSDEQKYDAESTPTGFFSDITDEEKATLDAETQKKVMGVFVMGGTRKGVFVHKTSIHDSKGLSIRIR